MRNTPEYWAESGRHSCYGDVMAERSAARSMKRTFRTSEPDSRLIDQMMADDGYTTFQSWIEYRLFGRRAKPRRPGPATDQRPLEGIKDS